MMSDEIRDKLFEVSFRTQSILEKVTAIEFSQKEVSDEIHKGDSSILARLRKLEDDRKRDIEITREIKSLQDKNLSYYAQLVGSILGFISAILVAYLTFIKE